MAEHASPAFVIKGMVKHGSSAKSPKVLEELALHIGVFLKEFGPAGFPLQEVIDFGVTGCGHANKKVRDTFIQMVTTIYEFVGEPIKEFLKGVKSSTLKVIEDSFSKTEVIDAKQFQSKRQVIGEEEESKGAASGGFNLLDNLPR